MKGSLGWVDSEAAPARVARAGAALVRARRLQHLVAWLAGGAFWGLALGAGAALVWPAPPLVAPAIALSVALLVALALALARRPDPLECVVRADLACGLEQRLSSAWELARSGDEALARRLAVQAVRARLPARGADVYPLRLGRWGQLAPLAGAGLALALGVSVPPEGDRTGSPDARVAGLGRALVRQAASLAADAERARLPRSRRAAQRLRGLGVGLATVPTSREDALGQLEDAGDSLAALAEAARRGAAPAAEEGARGSGELDPDGGSRGAGAGASPGRPGPGLGPGQGGTSADRPTATDLARRLERLVERERALADAARLEKAGGRLRSLAEPLASPVVPRARATAPARDPRTAGLEGASTERFGGTDMRDDGQPPSLASTRTGWARERARRRAAPAPPPPGDDALVVTPRRGEGVSEVVSTTAQPPVFAPRTAEIALAPRFTARGEEAVAGPRYPARLEPVVRRYFVELAARAEEARR